MDTAEIRRRFVAHFENGSKWGGHQAVPSASLLLDDPNLLFVNAGMVPFKPYFVGDEAPPYRRAVSVQKCVRAGGKHNDLEEVGRTNRHFTFFEMLGNFSFGDYFKAEAIQYAWDFVTGTLGIDPKRLWVTVYKDDDEAADIWLEKIGVDPKRFSRMDEKSNFWAMGDTGPCGPCSEIFYDHGPGIAGGPPGSKDEDGDRYVEIWNLVFMQFEQVTPDKRVPLPRPSIDTGMGLERITAVLQGHLSDYDTDLFTPLLAAVGERAGTRHGGSMSASDVSMRVIADHLRAMTFLIADGVVPSNEWRGYVLRKIMRRAMRHGKRLGMTEPFLFTLVDTMVREFGDAYPELARGNIYEGQVKFKRKDGALRRVRFVMLRGRVE